jgi:tRNA1(Val) A37 N6-methylase TrmN6
LTGIEAQEVSFRLWQSNLAGNLLTSRVRALFGDLRDLALGETFPLVTGSPPYFPAGTGVLPGDSQKAHARFELRGDVADYARAAKPHLAEDGWFVFCFPYPQKARALQAVAANGMEVARMIDVVPRAALAPLFSLFACRHADASGHSRGTPEPDPPLVVRHADGRLTAQMAAVRRGFGFLDSPAHGGHGA